MKTIKQISMVLLYAIGLSMLFNFCRLSLKLDSESPIENFTITTLILLVSVVSIGFASLIKIPKD